MRYLNNDALNDLIFLKEKLQFIMKKYSNLNDQVYDKNVWVND